MNEYLATAPFDLYQLYLFQLVVGKGSFTRAAETAGITQSAMTRQMQGLESALGVSLLNRTTRRLEITEAGRFLLAESTKLVGDVESTLQRLRIEFAGARKRVRVGVSRTIGMAYLPGFFFTSRKTLPDLEILVRQASSTDILAAIEGNELDLGVLSPPRRLSGTVEITHRFKDDFAIIGPAGTDFPGTRTRRAGWQKWALEQRWLLLDDQSFTGQSMRRWLKRAGWSVEPVMQLDGFDLIINLVSLGMGTSLVPKRALALYAGKKTIQRTNPPVAFSRELVVATRRVRKMPDHLAAFIESILF